MARVWRDGQTRPVSVYRLATCGTIEEKIFQRQVTKQGLGGGLVDETGSGSRVKFHFTKEELKDLFSLDEITKTCSTHDLLDCDCSGNGRNKSDKIAQGSAERSCQLGSSEPKPSSGGIKDLLQWQHFTLQNLRDSQELTDDMPISYIFQNVYSS